VNIFAFLYSWKMDKTEQKLKAKGKEKTMHEQWTV
jgi:hypothetical protein